MIAKGRDKPITFRHISNIADDHNEQRFFLCGYLCGPVCGAPVLGTLIFFEKFPVTYWGLKFPCVWASVLRTLISLKNSLYWGLKFPCVWAPVLGTLPKKTKSLKN